MSKISIIDYGIGNVLSVQRAFEYWEAEVDFVSTPSQILKANHLVLPGVGAYKDGMQELKNRNLVEAIQEYCSYNRPFLGICLGMQMMLDESEEFGTTPGLKIIPGKVVRIEDTDTNGCEHKVPHIGWNELRLPSGKESDYWKGSILQDATEISSAYFVHSFTAIPEDPNNRLADTYYGGRLISAAIRKGNIYGTQFHPEKSGTVGLTIIRNFIKL